jgi:hypothetical protein
MGRNFAPGAEFRETAQLQASFVCHPTVGVFEEIPYIVTLQTEPQSKHTTMNILHRVSGHFNDRDYYHNAPSFHLMPFLSMRVARK